MHASEHKTIVLAALAALVAHAATIDSVGLDLRNTIDGVSDDEGLALVDTREDALRELARARTHMSDAMSSLTDAAHALPDAIVPAGETVSLDPVTHEGPNVVSNHG